MHKKDVCRNFYEALNEPDRIKQFLGYFQFLERYTHSTYKTLNFDNDAKALFNIRNDISKSCFMFFKDVFSESKNIAQRFHWCAILAWNFIEDSDIDDFLMSKKVRDKFSHGEHIEAKDFPVDKVKKLAFKMLARIID